MAETGPARNVEHFQQLIYFCTGYGADYEPSNAAMSFAACTVGYLAGSKPCRHIIIVLISARCFSDNTLGLERVFDNLQAAGAKQLRLCQKGQPSHFSVERF